MRPISEWDEKDIDEYYDGQIQESLTLEYKDSRSLQNTDHHKKEMFKDMSAMANSAGGIIIYGMKESGHLPTGTDDGADPLVIKREWIENVLNANIVPKVDGLVVKAVPLTSKGTGNVAYVLDIPRATVNGPHQGPDNKYYRRYNFSAVPMDDSDVRALMRRSLEYGRRFGAAFDLFVEISRLCNAATARKNIGSLVTPTIDQTRLTVSPDLRSAGYALVLLPREVRNSVREMILTVDAYNASIETKNPGSDRLVLDEAMRQELASIVSTGSALCALLRTVIDSEP
jgi:Putative DNA-binding domain